LCFVQKVVGVFVRFRVRRFERQQTGWWHSRR
jgi:hypothetical protein